MQSEHLYQDWVSETRRAVDAEDELDQLRCRAEAAEAERDEESVSRQRWADRAYRAERDLERMRATLPGLRKFLDDLARTAILPVRSHARMWSNSLRTVLEVENDDRLCEDCGSYWCGRRDDYTCTNPPAGGDDA